MIFRIKVSSTKKLISHMVATQAKLSHMVFGESRSDCKTAISLGKTDFLMSTMVWKCHWVEFDRKWHWKTVIVNSESYGRIIFNFFWPAIEVYVLLNNWFQQDNATSNKTLLVFALFHGEFPEQVITTYGDVNWPPRLCDLTRLNYYLWGYVKDNPLMF